MIGLSPVLLLVIALPSALVLVAVVALVVWALTGPGPDEPPARARLRRHGSTVAAAAVTVAAVLGLPVLLLGVLVPPLAVTAPSVAALGWVTAFGVGELLAGRRSGVHRTAALVAREHRRPPVQRVLLVGLLTGLTLHGLLAVAAVVTGGGVGPPNLLVGTAVLSVVVGLVTAAGLRRTARRQRDEPVHPEVDATARDRVRHRLLGGALSGTLLHLGLLAVVLAWLPGDTAGGATEDGSLSTVVGVLGTVLMLLGLVVAFLPPPPLALRPDVEAALPVSA